MNSDLFELISSVGFTVVALVLALVYAVLSLLIPIFIYSINVTIKRLDVTIAKMFDKQREMNSKLEACLMRILEEEIKSSHTLTAIASQKGIEA